jgi:serine/threonine-protein kinase
MAVSALLLDDRYQLIARVGSGGMPVVWHAFDVVLGRDVAVKLPAAGVASDPELPRLLFLEAGAVAAAAST